MVTGWLVLFVIKVGCCLMIITRVRTQGSGWDAQCRGKRLQHIGRGRTQPVLDLGKVGVGDAGHRRNLTHGQLSQLSLPTDDLAESQLIIRRLLCFHSLSIFTSARPEQPRRMPR